MSSKIKIVGLILVASLFIVSCSSVSGLFGKKEETNVYYGTIEANTVNISSEVPGKIKEVKVQEGSKINKGDIIAIIDSDENKIKMQQAEITVKSSENELGKIEEGNRQEEIKAQKAFVSQGEALVKQGETAVKQANNSLSSAQTNFDYKKKIYDDAKKLYEGNASSQYDLDVAKNQFDIANNNLENAKVAVENAKAQLEGVKSQLEASKQKLNLLVNGATERTKTAAKYGIDQANKNYELSKITASKNTITSAENGLIETINFKTGEYVTPGSPIATLIDTKNLWVKIYVPEKILPEIQVGKTVTLKSDFLKDKTINGKVSYISQEAEFIPMNVITKEDREKLVFAVKIQILDNLEAIKPGMLLDVKID